MCVVDAMVTLVERLRALCGPQHVLTDHNQLRTYESDGLLQYRELPAVAVLPGSGAEVAAVVRACHAAGVPWVARGSGSGLSGGALPVAGGALVILSRLRRILEVDLDNQRVVCEPGVTNLAISAAVGPSHFFPPDPSSQVVCSIGGNVAENSGGAHCFKYGFTTNYVCGLEVVLADGSVVQLGGKERVSPHYYVQDSVIPRTRLPEVLDRIDALSREYGLQVGNVFHAGDGNLHPLVCYDGHTPGEAERAEELAGEIVLACVQAGGSITGEHGVGIDK